MEDRQAAYLSIYVRAVDLPLLERLQGISDRRRAEGRRDYARGALLMEALAYWLAQKGDGPPAK